MHRNSTPSGRQRREPAPASGVSLQALEGGVADQLGALEAELAAEVAAVGFHGVHRQMHAIDDGYGIGLFVVQLSLQNHVGTIRICRSTQLGGAEVQLHFPIATGAS